MIDKLKFDEKGLIPAIIQDLNSKQVLMMAYMNQSAIEKTQSSGYTHFYSRSRNSLWMKGESSGHVQKVEQISYDCDQDCLLIQVEQSGAACHTGHYTCFYRNSEGEEIEELVFNPEEVYVKQDPTAGTDKGKHSINNEQKPDAEIINELFKLIQQRKKDLPEGSYTTYLFNKGIDKILKKVGEESAEVIIAAKNTDSSELIYESSDLIYHLLVLLAENNIEINDIFIELKSRAK